MAGTTTDFNQNPYNDDYDESKNFHRVIFVPKVPVQARELTQLQTILQDQIRRHGNFMFKDGSIIDGCAISYIPRFTYARLGDYCDIYDANTSSYSTNQLFDITLVANTIVESSTGLKAQVQAIAAGALENYPSTNRIYVKYLNSVSNGTVKEFGSAEQLTFYAQPRSANVIIARANTVTANATVNATGAGYGIHVGSGFIYQKGFFIRVSDQNVVVNNFSTDVGNTYIGFRTDETIITSDLDESLLDNALGYGNENAPGAHRLKLVPTLQAVDFDTADAMSDFTPIVTFIYGQPVQKGTDTALARLGSQLGKEKAEESGDYIVKPFLVDTRDHPSNSSLLQVSVGPGVGYVSGRRVELVKTAFIDVERGNNTEDLEGQIVTGSYGNYILVKERAGNFDFESLNSITFYPTAKQALTNRTFSGSAPSGASIGTAKVRAVRYVSGTPGTPDAVYALHLMDIRITSGKSFANAAAIYQSTTGAVADFVTVGKIYESTSDGLLFRFGVNAIKKLSTSTGNNNTQYTLRATTDATLASNGSITLSIPTSHGGGSDVLPYGVGNIGDTNENDFIIVTQSDALTANLTGTVVSNTSTPNLIGTSTTFSTNFSSGEYIAINYGVGTDYRRVVSVTNATHLVLDAAPSTANATGAKIMKYFPNGYTIPLGSTLVGTRTANVISNTQIVINVGLDAAASLASSVPVKITHNILRQNATAIPKTIRKSRFVKIKPSTNAGGLTGPWTLGVTDVHKIRGVYVGSGTYATSNPNQAHKFTFDPGQKETHYDHAYLKPKKGTTIDSNTTLLVEYDYFSISYTTGIGFFSVESYPIDDANTANTNAITTAEIPQVEAKDGTLISLRDCIDFRPRRNGTATITTDPATASENPGVPSTSWNVDTDGTYLIAPYANFQADLQYYLGRKDVILFTHEGSITVKSGEADANPREPSAPKLSMPIATVNIQPYPSLSSIRAGELSTAENRTLSAPTYRMFDTSSVSTVALKGNKGYTMRDIGALEERIERLEYYQTLSLLEKSATDMQIPDDTGLNRFKNGIFVDPFDSHKNGQVNNSEYKIALDAKKSELRPYFEKTVFDLEPSTLSGTVKKSSLVMLPYTNRVQLQQKLASKFRLCAPVARSWKGKVQLHPGYSFKQDEKKLPAKNITIDNTQAWEDFANSPFGQQFGEWEVTGRDVDRDRDVNGRVTTTTTTTTTTSQREVTGLTVGQSTTKYNLGEHVVDVSLQPFISSQIVSFSATGLRPNTRVYPFFDDENVSSYVRPGAIDTTKDRNDPERVKPSGGNYGSALITDSKGFVCGRFKIPAGKFRNGDRKFTLADVSSMTTGGDAITTSAAATFTAGGLALTTQVETLTTINPEIDFETTTQSQTQTSVSQTQTSRPPGSNPFGGNSGSDSGSNDPIAQTFTINIPDRDVPGVFATRIRLYFKDRSDSDNGIRVYLTETDNGYPRGKIPLAYSDVHLEKSEVNISNNASVATTVTFDAPVFLANGKEYAVVIKPDGDDPDYLIWVAELGATDVQTGKQISSQPAPGIFFVSANASTWTPVQTEDLKFELDIAQFSSTSGTVILSNQKEDYVVVSNVAYVSANVSMSPGDLVIKATNTAVVNSTTVNTSVYGILADTTDLIDERLVISRETGNFVNNTVFQIHNVDDGNVASISSNTLVGSFKVTNVEDREYHAIAPRVSNIQPAGTAIKWEWRGASRSGVSYTLDSAYVPVFNERTKEFYDKTRVLASRSNEVVNNANGRTSFLRATLTTTNSLISPVIDLHRRHIVAVKNLIDPVADPDTMATEYTNNGDVQTKYISKPVILADGQDAEDLELYLTAYRPYGSQILVYAKFLANEDPQSLNDKTWTLLEYTTTGASIYSDTLDVNDYREWKFNLRSSIRTAAPATSAYANPSSTPAGVIRYTDTDGAVYNSYKSFQIKIVLMSNNSARVPRLKDVRAIALQR
jgi:hypothetical protein